MPNFINIFCNPTPNQYFYLMIAHIVISTFFGYFFLSPVVFIVSAGILLFEIFFIGLSIYNLEKARSIQKLRKLQWTFLSTALVLLIFSTEQTFHKVVFRQELATNKTQLKTVSGIIQGRSTLEYGSGKHQGASHYLEIGNVSFLHCRENIRDSCDKVYPYKGKTATVYYLPTYTTGNVVYEMIVDNQKIYDFDTQLKLFKKERLKVNMEVFWVFVLFSLPLFYFFKIHYKTILQIPEMNDEEKMAYDIKKYQEENEEIQEQDIGNIGQFMAVFGILIIVCGIVSAILTYTSKKLSYFLVTILLFLLGGLLFYSAYYLAKRDRDIRLNRYK